MRTKIISALIGLSVIILSGAFDVSTLENGKPLVLEVTSFVEKSKLKSGDIIFQISASGQGKAIQLATHSKYTHCGIIYKEGNDYFVYEAVQPVKSTPLDEWIERGQKNHYVVKRLKNSDKIMNTQTLSKMKQVGEKYRGKNYDIYFGWSDEKIYCSELVWKIYKNGAGIELAKLQKLKDFDLSNDIVKTIMKERYGNKIPYNETVISPSDIYDSDLLTTVVSN